MALSVRPVKGDLCARAAALRFCATVIFVSAILANAIPAHAATNKRIAVLMFKPQNYGIEWVDEATARQVVWTGAASADAYYQEESFGKWALTGALSADGDVFGWYTVPYNDVGTCMTSINYWAAAAKTAAAQEGFVA